MKDKRKKSDLPKMLPKLKKTHKLRLKIIFFSAAIFLTALSLLILSPQAVQLIDTKISDTNMVGEKPQYLITAATGLEKKSPPQILDSKIAPPKFSSQAVLAQDFETGQILYQQNINLRLAPASTTKILTALVAVDYFQPGDTLVVTPQALVGGSSMGLNVGEKLSFRSLLYGMLLNSGNDASYTIALNYPGGFDNFVSKMNEKITQLGLQNSHFENPAGFDGSTQYSTASDLAIIGKAVSLHPQLARIVATKDTSIISLDNSKNHNLRNLNKLLNLDGVIGIKTGTTQNAGENFVGLVERDNHKIITVVLKSQDRFGETKALIDWVYQNFTWR